MGLLKSIYKGARHAVNTAVEIANILFTLLPAFSAFRMLIRFITARPLTRDTVVLITENWAVVLYFVVDLMEPLKRYVPGYGEAAIPSTEKAEDYLPYDELDMNVEMNRHGAICQIQRVIKSIIVILRMGNESWTKLNMDTKLESDPPPGAMKEMVVPKDASKPDETWLFINGICNEYYWTVLSIDKLAKRFFNHPADDDEALNTPIASYKGDQFARTTLKGVFNRSDGVFWDIVECAGQRDFGNAEDGVLRGASEITKSSLEAQATLRQQIIQALDANEQDVVMIAHSQGCLILRLVFRDFQTQEKLQGYLPLLRKRMDVYTFGNPAYEWDCHRLVRHTEHFANELDFVAQLGVLGSLKERGAKPPARGIYQCEDCRRGVPGHPQMVIWENEKMRGHLFGSQYSLEPKDYKLLFPLKRGITKSKLLSRNRGDGEQAGQILNVEHTNGVRK